VWGTSGGCAGGTIELFVEAQAFAGKSLVAQHKWVKTLLKDEIRDVHAITLQTALPPQ
jgi:stress-induced morphogen